MSFLNKWDRRFIRLAEEISLWSKDPDRQVGAVLVKDKTRFAVGYNGFPPGIADTAERLLYNEVKQKLTNHAEVNAILNAAKIGFTTEGCRLYCTYHPCHRCATAIIASGVNCVVCPSPDLNPESKWRKSQSLASDLFFEANVLVLYSDEISRTILGVHSLPRKDEEVVRESNLCR